MRLFVALRVPTLDLTDPRFGRLLASLDQGQKDEHWIPQEQLHIPLLEIGDLGQGGLMAAYERLKPLIGSCEAFQLRLSGIWGNPVQKEAELLWIGVQNSRPLRALQGSLLEVMEYEEDHLVRPHVPLVTFKRARDVTDAVSPFKNFDFGSVKISELRIMERLGEVKGVQMRASFALQSGSGAPDLQAV